MKRLFSYKHVSVRYHEAAHQSLFWGIDQVRKTVEKTLGPRGRPVAVDYEVGPPKITKDGVTVVKHIEFADSWKDLGCKLIKFPAHETNVFGGDGTTTATVLAAEIIDRAFMYMRKAVNPILLRESLEEAAGVVQRFLERRTLPLTSEGELKSLARVATNHDEHNAELVVRALLATGKDGNVSVEEGSGFDNKLIVRDGLIVNRGVASDSFIEDNGYADVRLDDALVLTAGFKLHNPQPLLEILEHAKETGRSLLVAAEDIDKEALATLLLSRTEQELSLCAINFPYEHNEPILHDVAAFCGSTHCASAEQISVQGLGSAKRITIDKDLTVIYGGSGSTRHRKEQLEYEFSHSELQGERENIRERIKRLAGKTAIIEIGIGGGHVEIQERRDRIVDALNSVKSAMRSGILPGGGSCLFYAARHLKGYRTFTEHDIGYRILREALSRPLEIIAETSPRGIVTLDELELELDEEVGLDAVTGELVNMLDAGIIDSSWIVQHSVRSAVSLAQYVISTSAVVGRDIRYEPTRLKHYRKEIF